MAKHLRPGIRHVRQHARGAKEHVVFDDGPRVDRHVVLDLDVRANDNVIRNIAVLAEDAVRAYLRALLDVAEVPDLRAVPNLAWFVDVSGFVFELRHAVLGARDACRHATPGAAISSSRLLESLFVEVSVVGKGCDDLCRAHDFEAGAVDQAEVAPACGEQRGHRGGVGRFVHKDDVE